MWAQIADFFGDNINKAWDFVWLIYDKINFTGAFIVLFAICLAFKFIFFPLISGTGKALNNMSGGSADSSRR